MKLLYAKGACSLSVHILLEEMQLKHEALCVAIDKKTVILTYNPLGYVPVLILDSGEVITEATVILPYLAENHKGTPFIPDHGTIDRIRCLEWLVFCSTELHQKLAPLFHREGLKKEYEQLVEQKLGKRLQHLDNHLKQNRFLMGHQYTIADMYALAILRIAEHVKIKVINFGHVYRYKKMLESMPVIKKVIEMEERATTVTSMIQAA
jgi:glutathione S-transferase